MRERGRDNEANRKMIQMNDRAQRYLDLTITKCLMDISRYLRYCHDEVTVPCPNLGPER